MNVTPVKLQVSELLRDSPMAIEPEIESANTAGAIARAVAIANKAKPNFLILPPGSPLRAFVSFPLSHHAWEITREVGKLV
jgi:hypothetical protein